MINSNKPTEYSTKPFLRLGFRPFFFVAGVCSVVLMIAWIVIYQLSLPIANISDSVWHAHEMIFAYATATIVGFLLTASGNWTGIQTLYGKPLMALLLLWILGRFSLFVPADYWLYQALIGSSFLILSTIAIGYPIIKGKNWVNVSIVGKLILLSTAQIVYYLGALNLLDNGVFIGLYLGLYLTISLLFMMVRRLLPFFIERGLGLDFELKNSKILDISSLLLLLVFIVVEVFYTTIWSNILAGALFIAHSIRLFNWYHPQIWNKSLLWSIYTAYALLILGFGLKALSYFVVLLPNITTHTFAFGLALMTLSMMSRVALGHTGRDVFNPPKILNWMFVLLSLAFVFRVIVISIDPGHYLQWIFISQVLWVGAFSVFVWFYTPMFFQSRVDSKFG